MAVISNGIIVRVRRTPGGEDEYGDPIAGTETRETQSDWATFPRTSSDINDRGRNGVVVGLGLLTPYGADLLRSDLVEVNGELYEVDGDVGLWKSPLSSWEAGTETALRRATG